MKKFTASVSKLFKKVSVVFGFVSLVLVSLTSCENFLKSEDVKNEIVSFIDYNNAPSYVINVEALIT